MGLTIKRKETQKQLLTKSSASKKAYVNQTLIAAALSSPAKVNDLVPKLALERVPIEELKPPKRRARNPGANHVANVIKSVQTVGQVAPILIDAASRVVDGNVVVEALKALGEAYVSAVRLDHLNEDQLKLVRISLNKLAEGSVWDIEELRLELDHLADVGYDLSITGFSLPELDIIRQIPPDELAAGPEETAEPPREPVSELGDLWVLGNHKLLCANALDEQSYLAILGSERAAASFTDCPWNLAGKSISSKHGDFKMAAGEMSDEAFQDFCDAFTQLIASHLADGGVLFSCIDWRSDHRIVEAGRKAGLRHINTIVWSKGSGGMGGLYRSAHELIPTFCKGAKPKTNNIELGKHGRDRTNVWVYPGANTPGSSAAKAVKHHPTPKPVEMVEDALLDVTNVGELVLDPFMGSGTTLLAAQRCGRAAAGIELDPAYVDLCIRRWQEMTGAQAVHAETQRSFDEVAVIRSAEGSNDVGE